MNPAFVTKAALFGPLVSLAMVVVVGHTVSSGKTRHKGKRVTRQRNPIQFRIEVIKELGLLAFVLTITIGAIWLKLTV